MRKGHVAKDIGRKQDKREAGNVYDFTRWVNAHPGITAPSIGARNIGQLNPALDAVKINMTEDLYKAISDLSPQPPPATDRNEEKTEFNYGLRR